MQGEGEKANTERCSSAPRIPAAAGSAGIGRGWRWENEPSSVLLGRLGDFLGGTEGGGTALVLWRWIPARLRWDTASATGGTAVGGRVGGRLNVPFVPPGRQREGLASPWHPGRGARGPGGVCQGREGKGVCEEKRKEQGLQVESVTVQKGD